MWKRFWNINLILFWVTPHRWHCAGALHALSQDVICKQDFAEFFLFVLVCLSSSSLCKLHRQQSLNSDISTVVSLLSYLLRYLSFETTTETTLLLFSPKQMKNSPQFHSNAASHGQTSIKWKRIYISQKYFSLKVSHLLFFRKTTTSYSSCRVGAVWKIEKLAKSPHPHSWRRIRSRAQKVWTFAQSSGARNITLPGDLTLFRISLASPPVSFETLSPR